VAQPDAGTSTGSGGQGGFVILGTGGQGGRGGSGTAGSSATGTAGSGSGGTETPRPKISTCGCDTAEGPRAGTLGLLLAGVALALGRRRRAAARPRRK